MCSRQGFLSAAARWLVPSWLELNLRFLVRTFVRIPRSDVWNGILTRERESKFEQMTKKLVEESFDWCVVVFVECAKTCLTLTW